MRDVVTTLLDAVGLLVFAAGVCVVLGALAGWGVGLMVSGGVILAGSWWAARQGERGEAKT